MATSRSNQKQSMQTNQCPPERENSANRTASDGRPSTSCCASWIPGETTGGDRVKIGGGHSGGGVVENGVDLNSRGRFAFARRHGFDCPNALYEWVADKFGGAFEGVVIYNPPISNEDRYRAALEHELALAEKQVELLKLRVDQGGHDHVKPFGTDAWKRAERLRAVLRHNI